MNFFLDEETKKIELESMLTHEQWLDVLSCPRFDPVRGVMKKFFKLGQEDLDLSSTDDEDDEEDASVEESSSGEEEA